MKPTIAPDHESSVADPALVTTPTSSAPRTVSENRSTPVTWRLWYRVSDWCQQAWQQSLLWHGLVWYRGVWMRQPGPHTGLLLLATLAVLAVSRLGLPWSYPEIWLSVVWGGAALAAWRYDGDWNAMWRDSVVLSWWSRQRTAATMASTAVKQEVRYRYDRYAQEELRRLATSPASQEDVFPLEQLTPAKRYFVLRKMQMALRLAELPPGARVLEVGCARGLYTLAWARRGLRMTGADLSPDSVAVARGKAERLGDRTTAFAVADAETLNGLPSATFDAVMSFSTLRYVPDLDRALAAIARVLKPGGVAVLDFPNRWCPWFSWIKPFTRVERHAEDRYFAASELRGRLARAGFAGITTRHLLFTPAIVPPALLPFFRLADAVGERLPGLNRLAAIIMCTGIRRA